MNAIKKAVGICLAILCSLAITIGLNKGLLGLFGKNKIVYNPDTGDSESVFGYPEDDIIPFVIFFCSLVVISVIFDKIKK